MTKTFSISTLGCRANQADSERLRGVLVAQGLKEVAAGKPCDYPIVNSCTVTHEADRKVRQTIRKQLKVVTPGHDVLVTGCGVAKKGGLKSLPAGVSSFHSDSLEELYRLVGVEECPSNRVINDPVRAHRTRALLKIQQGCNQFCTFCIVPYVRGRSQSVSIDKIVEEAQALEAQGYQELVITGIHLSAWGRDLDDDVNLSHALEAILMGTESPRVRLSSVEPDGFPLRVIDIMERHKERFCGHLHLVLQHADDTILTRMHRGYTQEEYTKIVDYACSRLPDLCLMSDILVGFPGEQEEHFDNLLAYLERTPFAKLHVFPYSDRAGTAASKFESKVSPEVKKARKEPLLAYSERVWNDYATRFIGRLVEVIGEQYDPELHEVQGTSMEYLPVVVSGGPALQGKKFQARIESWSDGKARAEVYQELSPVL